MRGRRGFTFTEVMFAVVILGVGFLMIAALLPVAIKQTKESADETAATATATAAIKSLSIEQDSQKKLFAPTGVIVSGGFAPMSYFGDTTNTLAVAPNYFTVAPTQVSSSPQRFRNQQMDAVAGMAVNSNDPRFGWVAMYSRSQVGTTPSPIAKLVVIATRCNNAPSYTSDDTLIYPTIPANLMPKRFNCTLDTGAPGQPQTLTFTAVGDPSTINALGEGAFVVIASDVTHPNNNGEILRLGPSRGFDTGGNPVYALAADFDASAIPAGTVAQPRPTNGETFVGFVVGKAIDADGNFSGTVQDIGVYKALVTIPQ